MTSKDGIVFTRAQLERYVDSQIENPAVKMNQGDPAISDVRERFRLRNTQAMRTFLRGFIRNRVELYRKQNPTPAPLPPAVNPLPVANRNVDVAIDQLAAIQNELKVAQDNLRLANERYEADMTAANADKANQIEMKVAELKQLQEQHDKTVQKLEQIRAEFAEMEQSE